MNFKIKSQEDGNSKKLIENPCPWHIILKNGRVKK